MSRRQFVPSIVLVAILGGVPVARAQFTAQQPTVSVAFADLRFSNTTFTSTHRLSWTPRFASDSTPLAWFSDNTQPIISRAANPVLNCTIEGFQAAPANSLASYTLRAITASETIHQFVITSRPDNQRVSVLDDGGFAVLAFDSITSPLPTVTNATYSVILPGDWSSRGSGEGQLEPLAINPGWTIVRDWQFDGVNTIFGATRTAGTTGIGLRFRLHGSAIPAPAAGPALVLAAGLARRSRRAGCAHFSASAGRGTSKYSRYSLCQIGYVVSHR